VNNNNARISKYDLFNVKTYMTLNVLHRANFKKMLKRKSIKIVKRQITYWIVLYFAILTLVCKLKLWNHCLNLVKWF